MRKLWLQIVVLALCLGAVLIAKRYVERFAGGAHDGDGAPVATGSDVGADGQSTGS